MIDEGQRPSAKHLKSVQLLSSFSESELAQLIELGQYFHFEPYSNIVIEGELSWGLFIILDGLVGVMKTNPMTGQTYDIGHLRANNIFGELSLIDENPRSATVRALTKATLYFIPKNAFNEFLTRHPESEHPFLKNCVKILALMLRDLNDKYVIGQYQLWQSALKKPEEKQ